MHIPSSDFYGWWESAEPAKGSANIDTKLVRNSAGNVSLVDVNGATSTCSLTVGTITVVTATVSGTFTVGTVNATAINIGGLPVSAGGSANQAGNGFRLTLTSGSPAPSVAGVTGTTIYCTPYRSNAIYTYDNAVWTLHTGAEFSLALGTLTSGKAYDVFVFYNGSALTLEFSAAWASDTARTDAITQQDGVWVKSSNKSRRLLGTFYTTSTTQTKDAPGFRYLDNVDNRIMCGDTQTDGTQNWTLSTTVWSAMNSGNAAWIENYVSSLGEDTIFARASVKHSRATAGTGYVGIGIDSTSTKASTCQGDWGSTADNSPKTLVTTYTGNPGIGKHTVQVLNGSDSAGGTSTFYSNPGVGALDTSPHGLTVMLMR